MEKVQCPHCNSTDIFIFKTDIYIVNKNDFVKKPFYGCNACKSAFVILEEEPKKIEEKSFIKTTSATNVQKTLNRLSKGCMGVLENIK